MDYAEITRRLVALDTVIGQFAQDTRETASARRHLTEARLWWQEHLVKESQREQVSTDGAREADAASG
jgi:hypothetical protein